MGAGDEIDPEWTLYDILGADEEAKPDEIIKAYRQRALDAHPDKGGDAAAFDELVKAFKILGNADSRETYDVDLAKARQREKLVVGKPAQKEVTYSKEQAQAPMRQKTAPHPGSVRQGKMRTFQPGNFGHCASEWVSQGSGAGFMKMICDDLTEEQKTVRLFEKYASLPPGKEKKQEWVRSIHGKEKQDLKKYAKEKEKENLKSWDAWLAHGPSKARQEMKREAAAKAVAEAREKRAAAAKAQEAAESRLAAAAEAEPSATAAATEAEANSAATAATTAAAAATAAA